jgi:hypothetical protein
MEGISKTKKRRKSGNPDASDAVNEPAVNPIRSIARRRIVDTLLSLITMPLTANIGSRPTKNRPTAKDASSSTSASLLPAACRGIWCAVSSVFVDQLPKNLLHAVLCHHTADAARQRNIPDQVSGVGLVGAILPRLDVVADDNQA